LMAVMTVGCHNGWFLLRVGVITDGGYNGIWL
jgi:hypothetical protein